VCRADADCLAKKTPSGGFFSQILNSDGGCTEVVRKFQAIAGSQSLALPSTSTLAYCQVCLKLEESDLQSILSHTLEQLAEREGDNLFHGRQFVVVDGAGVSMPDTSENQQVRPQSGQQQLVQVFIVRRTLPAYFSNVGMLSCSFEISKRRWEWTFCAANHPAWFLRNC
jgi:hypothetical protein